MQLELWNILNIIIQHIANLDRKETKSNTK